MAKECVLMNLANIVVFVDVNEENHIDLTIQSGFNLQSTKEVLRRAIELLEDPENAEKLTKNNS